VDIEQAYFDVENAGSYPAFCTSSFFDPITIGHSNISTFGPLGVLLKTYGTLGAVTFDSDSITIPSTSKLSTPVDASNWQLYSGTAGSLAAQINFKGNSWYSGNAAFSYPQGISYTSGGISIYTRLGLPYCANDGIYIPPEVAGTTAGYALPAEPVNCAFLQTIYSQPGRLREHDQDGADAYVASSVYHDRWLRSRGELRRTCTAPTLNGSAPYTTVTLPASMIGAQTCLWAAVRGY
jgi:hypothetical protein